MLIKYSNTEKLAPLARELGESPFNIEIRQNILYKKYRNTTSCTGNTRIQHLAQEYRILCRKYRNTTSCAGNTGIQNLVQETRQLINKVIKKKLSGNRNELKQNGINILKILQLSRDSLMK